MDSEQIQEIFDRISPGVIEGDPFADDSIASVYRELKMGEQNIIAAWCLHQAAVREEKKLFAKYDKLKHDYIRQMIDEEKAGTVPSRSVEKRKALYRIKYHAERLEWQQAEADIAAAESYLRAVQNIQTSIESRAKAIERKIWVDPK